MIEMQAEDFSGFTAETQAIWDQNAAWWDDIVGSEGNLFHRALVGPAAERLLSLQPGERVLDIACGNGQFARRLAELGAEVVACDFSEVFIERARARTVEKGLRIDYRVIDATAEAQLLALGRQRFDAAVCNMGLMDMTTIDPLLAALSQLLKGGGRFVFSLSHPCFNSNGSTIVGEQEDREGELVTAYAIKVSAYKRATAKKGLGIRGQPAAHYYFHRSISDLLAAGFRAGFVLDGLEEPVFEQPEANSRPFSWSNFQDIPPLLAARLRLLKSA